MIQYHPDSSDLEAVIGDNTPVPWTKCTQEHLAFWACLHPIVSILKRPSLSRFCKLPPYHKTPQAYIQSAKIVITINKTSLSKHWKKINDFSGQPITEDAYFAMAHIYSEFIKGPEYDLESTQEAIRYCEDFCTLSKECWFRYCCTLWTHGQHLGSKPTTPSRLLLLQ